MWKGVTLPGEAIVQVHYDDPSKLDEIRRRLLSAYTIGPDAPAPRPLVHERLE